MPDGIVPVRVEFIMSDSGRLPPNPLDGAEATTAVNSSEVRLSPPAPSTPDQRTRVRSAETRLLYENATTGAAITIVIALLLVYAQWDVVPHAVLTAWLLYM